MASVTTAADPAGPHDGRGALGSAMRLLWHDKFALASAIFLLVVLLCAIFGPTLFSAPATGMNLRLRNAPPFSLERGWLFFLGADALGRSMLARLIVASQNTVAIAGAAVVLSMVVGGILGLLAGYRGGWIGEVIMRIADILMSFPSLLLALIVLYVLEPRVANLVFVLAITRVPIYVRTTRAEVLEIRERVFVTTARVMGASPSRIVWRHIAPAVVPTLVTIATLDFAYVMLAEAALSFLGLGIQPPDITWGLMVSEGRNYLGTAWWLSFWPGLAIMLTTLALNLVASWLRVLTDPMQRWRLEITGR
jgi:peptide/nickel transport system permease protein